jgi:hypothetical protein
LYVPIPNSDRVDTPVRLKTPVSMLIRFSMMDLDVTESPRSEQES